MNRIHPCGWPSDGFKDLKFDRNPFFYKSQNAVLDLCHWTSFFFGYAKETRVNARDFTVSATSEKLWLHWFQLKECRMADTRPSQTHAETLKSLEQKQNLFSYFSSLSNYQTSPISNWHTNQSVMSEQWPQWE